MANCWVKFVAPLASVMVPAASSKSWLKSRLFKGSELTAWLDSSSPPEVAGKSPFADAIGRNAAESVFVPALGSGSVIVSAPGLPETLMGWASENRWLFSINERPYAPCGTLLNRKFPSAEVVAVNALAEDLSSMTAPETGAPEAVCNAPVSLCSGASCPEEGTQSIAQIKAKNTKVQRSGRPPLRGTRELVKLLSLSCWAGGFTWRLFKSPGMN
jgi:hypothetical protein